MSIATSACSRLMADAAHHVVKVRGCNLVVSLVSMQALIQAFNSFDKDLCVRQAQVSDTDKASTALD